MELVVEDGGLWSITLLESGVAERLPHVHDRQANFPTFLGAQPGEELVQAGFRTVLAAEPDGPTPLQVADHDAVLMPLGDGDLIDADDPRSGVAGPAELLTHILLVQLLDGVPIEVEFLGDFLDGGFATASAHEEGEAFGVQRVVGKPIQAFALHGPAPPTRDPAQGVGKIDPLVATGEVSGSPWPLIVVGPRQAPANATKR